MGQVCTICSHVQSLEIDAAFLRGEPARAVAREFGLTEAAVRRHRANHLFEKGPEMVPDAPTRPAESLKAPESQEDARSAAQRLYENEEIERRSQRLAELERQEQDRRERAAAEQKRADALAAARQRLAALRGELPGLDDDIERLIDELAEAIDARMKVEHQLYAALTSAGTPFYGAGFKPHLRQFLSIKLPDYVLGASFDERRGAPLRERDPMAAPDGAPPDVA